MSERKGFFGWLGNTLENRSGWVITVIVLITICLLFPLILMSPTEQASDNPTDNEIVQLADHIEDTFSLEVMWVGFIVEGRDGDVLTQKSLAEVYERTEALKQSELAQYLYLSYDEAASMSIQGVFTIADAVNEALVMQSGGTLDIFSEKVTDEQIKAIIGFLMESPAAEQFHESLSSLYEYDSTKGWTSPALIVSVLASDERVLTDYLDDGTAIDEAGIADKSYAREAYALDVQEIMRGDQVENEVIGMALDLEHEIEKEGMIGGIMLFAALILMAILLLIIFRSVIIMVLTVGGLGMLIIWFKGISNLVGLKGSMIVDIILPVAIVVLGVDYAIQSLFRYRERRAGGDGPREALGNSTSRVGRALVLAMFTTIIAFISNATASIESVIGFAVAASIAIFASFILLGLFVPTVTMKWRARRYGDYAGFWLRFFADIIDGIVLAIVGGICVIISSDAYYGGVAGALGIVYIIGFWVWRGQTPGKMLMFVKIQSTDEKPITFGRSLMRYFAYLASSIPLGIGFLWILWDTKRQGWHDKIAGTYVIDVLKPKEVVRGYASSGSSFLGNAVIAASDRWKIVLPVALIITVLAAWGWSNVETKMDAADALKADSDFVVGLDKWDVHGADKGGEPSLLYFEGNLTQIESIEAMYETIDQMNREGEEAYVGNDPISGEANANSLLLDVLEALVGNEYAKNTITEATGTEITDLNNDLIPDTQDQLQAAYDYIIENGLPEDENTLRYRPMQIAEAFVKLDSGDYATTIAVGVPGTREQTKVRVSQEQLQEDMGIALAGVESISDYGITGSGNVRVVQFDAIADALTSSLIIAIAAVLLILLVVFRSIRYAVLTLIPVLLVATWLYGFMYIAGYSLNMLTATIAAISIGVGIDFSIHFTERFREELGNGLDKRSAILKTAQSTGFALFCTALTTMLGFAVIAFAPMPMFSTFGILTAIMIVLALLMALFVLPSLLMVFVRDSSGAAKGPNVEH